MRIKANKEKPNQAIFKALCRAHHLPEPVAELQFAKPRRWRFDFAWPAENGGIFLEVDGGAFAGKPCTFCGQRKGGRHNRGAGFLKDIEKINHATLLGWRCIRATPQMVESGEVFEILKQALNTDNSKENDKI
jgi:hypothetical protein